MTTATAAIGTWTMETTETMRPRRSLEELVDRVFAAMGFTGETETQPVERSATRSIHEARRLRQAGDIDNALAALGDVNVAGTTPREVRWAFSEWSQLVKRRFGDQGAMVYSQGVGRAAALVPTATGRWRSRRSWGCAGGPARSFRGAASGGCGPWRRLVLDQRSRHSPPGDASPVRLTFQPGRGRAVLLTLLGWTLRSAS